MSDTTQVIDLTLASLAAYLLCALVMKWALDHTNVARRPPTHHRHRRPRP